MRYKLLEIKPSDIETGKKEKKAMQWKQTVWTERWQFVLDWIFEEMFFQ